jgi:hypothetical protein
LNPGALEEAVKATCGIIDALKREPLALGLIVLSLALIGFIFFQTSAFTQQRRENVALFVELQSKVQDLLSKCIIPPPPPPR